MTADHRSKCLAAEIDKLQAQIAELRKQRATQQQEIRENAHAKALLRFPQVPISADFQRKYFDLQCIFGGPTILEQKD